MLGIDVWDNTNIESLWLMMQLLYTSRAHWETSVQETTVASSMGEFPQEVKDLAAEAQEVVFETRGERPYPLQVKSKT